MKKTIGYLYLFISLLFGVYSWLWGSTSYKSFAYNLGKGFAWPATMFPELGAAIGGLIIFVVIIAVLIFVPKR